jgi:1-acyl-sn-glycerol-3-phosphate acyltransferase
VDTSGLENVPDEGRTLIVANHSGVLPFDGAMIGTAIYKFHPRQRYARFLIEDWFGQLPFATEFMNAVGQVRACQENAERLLRHEQLVGVFPEGIKGMAKGFKNRYNLARFGRGGVIRLAIRTRTPVVPCAVVGAEEIYIVLGYANWLGKMFGMPLFPITATFPWLGLLGVIPLPTKWYIQFGEVINYDEYGDDVLKDNVVINRLNRQLRATIQDMVDSALRKRRSLFFG